MGASIAEDGIKKQCHVILGPTINIQRDPRAGRYFESYSEDPVLTGELGLAWIQGCQAKGAAATMKHFVGNESETDRRNVSSNIDPSALREVYLEPFRRIMKGAAEHGAGSDVFGRQPACVMTAYNRVNSVSASENSLLMRDILRSEWGFDGLIMSDWFAMHSHALKTTDLEMPAPTMFRSLDAVKSALEKGEVTQEDLDDRVIKVLELVAKVAPLGYRSHPAEEKEDSIDMAKVSETIRTIGAEGAVLLKNTDELLPLQTKSGLRVACIGAAWVQAVQSGGGSANLEPQKVTQPLTVLRTALEGQDVRISHHSGCSIHNFPPVATAKTTVEYYTGRRLGSGERIATETLDKADMPAVEGKPAGLGYNNFWIRATFELAPERDGTHQLGLSCFGSLRMTTSRNETSEYSGESDLFEYFLNPAKLWKPLALEMQAGEKVQVTLDYLPQPVEGMLVAAFPSSFKVGFEYLTDEDMAIAEAAQTAAQADVALVITATGKDWESEGYDRSHLDLPRRQNEMVEAVSKVQANTVILNVTGSAVHMPWSESVKSIVQCWFGGQEGGEALVDVVLGRGRAPASGRMASTWPCRIEDHPSGSKAAHFPGEERADGLNVDYVESRLVGYKHYNAKPDQPRPAFVFGEGMGGYTSFEAHLSRVEGSCNSRKEHLAVHVQVRNTGKRSGKHVVQLYVRPHHSSPGRPVQKVRVGAGPRADSPADPALNQLAAFKAVHLEPGAVESTVVHLDGDAFSEWDESAQCWQVAKGTYTIALANSASIAADALLGAEDIEIRTGWSWKGVQ